MKKCPITFTDILKDLLDLVSITKTVIDRFFPPKKVNAPVISKMGYTVFLPQYVYMFLMYMQMYPDATFDDKCAVDLNNLKDIYLSNELPWQDDPFLSDAAKLGII